jgi:hypothetical protein
MLPDPEFLTAVEIAAFALARTTDFADQVERISEWLAYTDKVLRKNGLPYRLRPGTMNFEWIGDPAVQEIVLQPALLALADHRLQGGPRDDFERALHKCRLGAPGDLVEVMIAAARSVESVLKVLYEEHDVKSPSKHELGGLFNGLAHKDVGVVPGYLEHLVLAVGGPRNHMAGHGPGAEIRKVPDGLAEASIAAAATAIALLAKHLP